MTVVETIGKSERYLSKLATAYEKKEQLEVYDILSTLLVTIRSIPEHLLEDFNQKYNLGIPLEKRQFYEEFKKRSIGESRKFFEWHSAELKKIRADSKLTVLMDKRLLRNHQDFT